LRLEADAETSNFFDERGRNVLQGVSGFYPMIHSIPTRIVKMPKNDLLKVLTPADYSSWHQRLGHPLDIVLNRFFEETQGVPRISIPKKKPICDGCVKGKLTQKSFPQSESRATRVLELVHSDLFELPVLSYHCYKWVMTVLGDFSSTAYLVMLSSKSDAANQLINMINFLSNLLTQKCLKLRTDRGGEYVNQKLKDFVVTSGIQHELTSPNVHQQNGRAERLNRTLHEKSQVIRMQACLPENWWEFSMSHAVFLYNRTPMQRLKWKTPFEFFHGTKPDLSETYVFGCGAHVFLPDEIRKNKLSARSELMIFLGFDGPNYKFMRLPNNVLFVSPQAIFDETHFPKCPMSKPSSNIRKRIEENAPRLPSPRDENNDDDLMIPPRHHQDGAPPAAQQQQPPRHSPPPPNVPSAPSTRSPSPCPGPSHQTRVESDDSGSDLSDDVPRISSKDKGKQKEVPPWDKGKRRAESPPDESERIPVPPPRRSQRETKVPNRPGNVYGDERPSKVLRDYDKQPFLPDKEQ
jgi:transposase InsO family protein